MVRGIPAICVAVACLWAGGALPASPRLAPNSWHDLKCERYRAAWASALRHLGRRGLSAGFVAAHDAYLASNCTRAADVRPRSPEELRLANVLVEMSMNFGAASTFVPFACR